MKPLLSAQDLAWRLGIPLAHLRLVAADVHQHYEQFSRVIRGKERTLKVPDERLKEIQRRILRCILAHYTLPENLHGGIPGRSPRTNAEQHLAKDIVVNLDVRDFFPSVSHREVARMFRREFRTGNEATWLLTRLTTLDGQLPQGAPTSTMIANLLLTSPVDVPTLQRASALGVVATRFVDDMAFSGSQALDLIGHTAKALSSVGLRTWRNEKLKIMRGSERQEVTGLTVNSSGGPSVSRRKRDRIRFAIHALRSLQDDAEFDRQLRSIRGRLIHVRSFNPGAVKRLQRQLDAVLIAAGRQNASRR